MVFLGETKMSNELVELSNSLAQATDRVAANLVAVHGETRGSSSGIIWRSGIIVTAEHALSRNEEIQVTLAGGRVAQASLAGRDPSTDIAVLKCVEADSAVSAFGDAATLRAGALALVVGRTRVSGPVAALGVVSLAAPDRRSWTGTSLAPYVRLDVRLQSTAVGGAVLDASGNVAGLATPRFARFGAIVVPTATIHKVADTLVKKGHMPRGYFGIGLQPVRLPDAIREKLQREEKNAVIVLEVHPGGPADKAGMVIGDIIVSLGARPVARLDDVQSHLAGDTIGKSLAMKFVRGGSVQEGSIVVGERPHARE
jgi:S1-C subfamily serine protease